MAQMAGVVAGSSPGLFVKEKWPDQLPKKFLIVWNVAFTKK